jgi:type I restriction enzyme S subunit
MALNKIKLGELLEPISEKNIDLLYSLDNLKGISVNKEFIETKANMDGVSLKPYQLVKPGEFAYVTVTSRNSEKITIAYNDSENVYIVSSSYNVFRVKRNDLLNSEYLFMYFNRPEFDRYSRYNSWGSAREVFSWQEMLDIELELPDLLIQEKFVKIYLALVENQSSYELGLEDLKLVCDAYIENLRKVHPSIEIGPMLKGSDEKNTDLSVKLTRGIDVNMQFIPAKREAANKENARIVRNNQFAFNKVVKSKGTKLPFALRKGPDCIISNSYQVFEVVNPNLLPEYLMMWMSRSETQRYCGFNAWGSTRDVFPFEELCKLKFPIPSIKVQKSIVNIYNCYRERKAINEKLKKRIKNICPILIKGSIEEAR